MISLTRTEVRGKAFETQRSSTPSKVGTGLPALVAPQQISEKVTISSRQALTLPDWSDKVDPKGWGEGVEPPLARAAEKWIDDHLSLTHPEETNVMKGLGHWVALQTKLQVCPDWAPYESSDQTTMLWDDEQLGAGPPINPALTQAERAEKKGRDVKKTLGVLRMLDSYLGEGTVNLAVRDFLIGAAEGKPASLEGFHKTLKERSKERAELPSLDEFRGWFTQVGHPIIRTSLKGKTLSLQQRGFSVYKDQEIGNEESTWTVPLRVKFKDSEGLKEVRTLLRPGTKKLELPSSGKVEWAYPNGGGMGLFRTALNGEELKAITKDAPTLNPAEQTALMCNQWRLVRRGEAKIGEFYDMLRSLKNDMDSGLLDIALIELTTHRGYVATKDQKAFADFSAEILGPTARKMGLDITEEHDQEGRSSRRFMTELMADAGDKTALNVADKWARELASKGSEPFWGAGLISNDPEVAKSLWKRVESTLLPNKEVKDKLSQLAALSSPGNLQKVFDFVQDPESKLEQETRDNTLHALTYTDEAKPLVFNALVEDPKAFGNSETLLTSLGHGSYREQVEALLSKDSELSPEIRQRVQEKLSGGSALTLRSLTDDIHDYLQARSSKTSSQTQQTWNIAG